MNTSEGLAVFWVEDMPPTIGGIQKRISSLANALLKSTRLQVSIVQRRGAGLHGRVPALTCAGEKFVEHSERAIRRLLNIPRRTGRLLYVAKPVTESIPEHVSAILDLSDCFDITVIRVASSRSAQLLQPYAASLRCAGVRMHCLNSYSYSVLYPEVGASLANFHNTAGDVEHVGIYRNGPVVFAGRLVPSKNVLSLVEAWGKLAPDRTCRQLQVWGPCEDSYGQQVVKFLGRTHNSRYMGIYPSGSWSGLRGASVVVVPSLREGASNVVAEALALGKFVVGARIPGVEEYLPPDESRLINHPCDPAAIGLCLDQTLRYLDELEDTAPLSLRIREWYEMRLAEDAELNALAALVGSSPHRPPAQGKRGRTDASYRASSFS